MLARTGLVTGVFIGLNAASVLAQSEPPEPAPMATVEVEGRATDLLGVAASASQGLVGQAQFNHRPLARVGELIEVVPGLLATQHSGSGKANQYFLRGFNLDHGTDFAVTADGVPMNMPSHAHGQGYLDLNSLIPELVDKVEYGKGPYYADSGNFSSAGYARMRTLRHLEQGFVKFTGGEYGYYRTVAANSTKLGAGEWLYGGEMNFYDGVWQVAEDTHKFNGLLRYSRDGKDWGLTVDTKAYHNTWNATNQIPLSAVRSGEIDRYGSGDPSDGGTTNRYSLSANAWSRGKSWQNKLDAYLLYSDLDLYSNFTGYLDHPLLGDQLNQRERRWVGGASGEQTWFKRWFGLDMDTSLGLQIRHDSITGLALNHSVNRRVFQTVSNDDVGETHGGLFIRHQIQWLAKFRTVSGLRGDFFDWEVNSHIAPENSGRQYRGIFSPKLSLIAGPWAATEFFLNLGYGYHSNDARGTTLKLDPGSGGVAPVSPLTRQRGAELGMRSQTVRGWNITLALWWLQSDSELVWQGDTGSNEPTGKSERYGVEWTNNYQATDWLTLDADLACSAANYTDAPHTANRVSNSVRRVVTAGAVADLGRGFFATSRVRHFGDVPLDEANRFNSGSTTLVSLGLGYQQPGYQLQLEVFNLFNSKQYDIAYHYNYRTQNDVRLDINPEGRTDIIFHPVEPQMLRMTAMVKF